MKTLLVIEALDAALALFARAQAYVDLVAKARAEDRDITKEELDGLRAADDLSRSAESAAIASAKGEGR